jgi:hypothetical protein
VGSKNGRERRRQEGQDAFQKKKVRIDTGLDPKFGPKCGHSKGRKRRSGVLLKGKDETSNSDIFELGVNPHQIHILDELAAFKAVDLGHIKDSPASEMY